MSETKEISVRSITVVIRGHHHELTVEEARTLHEKLCSVFGFSIEGWFNEEENNDQG